jgi:hypothetical protein
MSNALSFRLCGDPKNPGIGVRMLKFTGDCVTTGSCETSGITYTTGHTIVDYCTPPIYPTCLLENPAWLDEEHWFQVDAVWERYTWLDTCDLWYRGGLGDITEKLYLESLANNASSLITVPYTQIDCKPSEQIELVRLNEKWLIDKLYRNGRLKIYVNGKLFHTIENFEEIIPRGLDTDKEKQVGVPFNISWGGGTQGLRENLTFSSITQPYGPYIQDPENFPINDLSGTTFSGLKTNILIEQNFAGTFDGAISQFRMYVTPLSAPEVKHNFNLLKNIFRMFNPDCPDCSTSVCLPNDFTYKISDETTTTTTTANLTTTTTTSNLTTTTTTTYSPTTTTTTYSPTTTTTTYSPTPTPTKQPSVSWPPTSTPTSTPTPTPTPTVYTPGECIRFIDEGTTCSGTIVLPSNINPSPQINGKSSYYFTYFALAPPTLLMRISWDNINNYWILEDMTTYYPLPDPLAYLPINSPTPIGSMAQWVALPSLIGSCLYGGGSGSEGPLFLTTTGIGDCSPCCKTFQLYSGFGPGTGSTYQILYCDNTVEVIDVPLYVTITYKCAINVIKLNGGGTVTVVDINCDCDPNNLTLFNEQKLGRIFIEDKRDNKYLIQDKLTIPKTTITKKEWDGNVWWGNQGNTPQCVGYAWAHWICDGPITHRGALPIIQPSLIYREAQKVDEWPGERYNGTSVRGGAKYLMSSGKISSYLWAFDINTLINTVLNVGPVVVGTNWYYNMFFPNKNGLIRLSGHIAGGHAYVINGVNTITKQFRIKNSWGKAWGVSGHAYISFSDMKRLIIERGEICLAIEKPF